MKRLGIDIGSLYLKAVLLDDDSEKDPVVHTLYEEHRGEIKTRVTSILTDSRFSSFDRAGITGNLHAPQISIFDSTLALIEGIRFLVPQTVNVFSIGGETFSLILFDEEGEYIEHSVNPPCASGTGSFLEQQSQRLSITPAELARKAEAFQGRTPSIATRCAVFAKTDIIHAMQEGYSLDAICAGLSEGIARSIIDVLVKGRELESPVAVVGGVSLNGKLIRTMESILDKEVTVAAHSNLTGAVGAALLGEYRDIDPERLFAGAGTERETREKLSFSLTEYPDLDEYVTVSHTGGNEGAEAGVEALLPKRGPHPASTARAVPAVMGIDIGSTSTKAVIITEDKEFLGGFYTKTGGAPIAAVQNILKTIGDYIDPDTFSLRSVGTTGSGRKMVRELFEADFHINEITAHAKAAVHLHPKVDTILEIGGQDSKFTRVRDGDVYFSTMNYVCAAGTGSFIEEQAKRLDLTLDTFSDAAFTAEAPFTSDRCTVYMERDLSRLVSEGWPQEALAAAVLNSVRDNYMAKVVNRSPLGDYIVFQGATARNRALVAAFENLIGKPIHVSPLCHLTGALGAALLGLEQEERKSAFRWVIEPFKSAEEICDRCANRCALTVIEIPSAEESAESVKKVGWGMKCGKEYDERKPQKSLPSTPEKRFRAAMAELEALSPAVQTSAKGTPRGSSTIGIPAALYNVQYAPLWSRFLANLGFPVVQSTPDRTSFSKGKQIVNSDFCAPMILSHGYMKDLDDRGADFIFSPAIINEYDPHQESRLFKQKTKDRYYCYYSQYLPAVVSKLTTTNLEEKLISPLLRFNSSTQEEIIETIYEELKKADPDLTLEETARAYQEASGLFEKKNRELASVYKTHRQTADRGPRIVLAGRPYIMFDSMLNLEIPRKIEDYGVDLFWMEEFDLEDYTPVYGKKYLDNMHWHYGRQIIKIAERAATTDELFIVYLTSFRCSPDAFLLSYVKDIMTHYDKPFLVLQLDEHSSDVGYDTRIEAGLHSFRNFLKREKKTVPHTAVTAARDDTLEKGDTVLVPYLASLMSSFWAECFRKAGYHTIQLAADERSLNTGYQYANGGECMPLVSLIGSVIDTVRDHHLDPSNTFFFIPTVCLACNFPQFPILSDLAFSNAGLKGLKIGLINSMAPGLILGAGLSMKILESNIIGGIIYKLYFRVKPYECRKGAADEVLTEAQEMVIQALQSGGDLRKTVETIVAGFAAVERDESRGRKPRIGIIGDLYVKYNEVINQNLQDLIDKLGGELIIPSLTEYPFHFYDADIRNFGDSSRPFRLLRTIEARYENLADELIGDQREPDFSECVRLMEEYNVRHYIEGETSLSLGRALYYLENNLVEAILHINPMFCCPGVVTASFYRKMQDDFGVPIIDIFYDGTGNPNRVLIPHMHYLNRKTESAGETAPACGKERNG
jgi:predicted CoA-substrate-specific enzyme activase